MLGSAPLARTAAEAPSARVSARAAPAAQVLQTNRLGTVARERRRVETTFGIRASRTSASAAVSTSSTSPASPASASTADGSSAHLEVVASPYASPSDVRFEPQIQVGPAVASLAILVAFAVVNRRVAAAVDRRKEREDAEEALRLAKLRSLDGSADFDEVQMFGDALENARAAEAEARQVLAFLGADVRVSVPQPLGKPIAQVEEEERRVGEEIRRRREAKEAGNKTGSKKTGSNANANANANADRRNENEDGPPGWMTATVGFVLAILAWSATGLIFSPDPAVGPALTPEQVEEQMAMRGYDAKRFQ
jgi:hypothetical protein